MKKIDAVGQACPMPVILTKRALKESNGEAILISVDNEIATQNLAKMAEQLKLSVQVEKINDSLYEVQLSDPNAGNEAHATGHTALPEQAAETLKSSGTNYVVVLNSDFIGNGSEELGRTLMKSFLFSLTEQEILPEKVLCYNAGALLTMEGSSVLDDLKALEEDGVEVLTCGICGEFYGVKDKLVVGTFTNMYRIVEIMRTAKIVSP
ncbi:sulfurtransferase-like selenium metabolism protein YedF [Trichococcus shcherbakoviae]|uniref:Sulfurtransferase-like selenium metabolism protein YedF n=1 Tax=Trichococcus shcherbakoviae subsp. psychrophilus TaxID=2585775 RepID=A0A5C5ECG0_9LACT|nr:sulfurtransferase-like selenium metabolism protein YedF [Trichococcus shcherbakoviae]TNV70293.1 sulfurtransferase-like selenium metabolism protein YedF [Trichococcus shcherbakoviae subsp. psychrophilus]